MKPNFADAAKKMFAFVIRHRFEALLLGIIAYLIFWPKAVPHIAAQTDTPTVAQQSQVDSNSIPKSVAYLPLYDPTSADADSTWSLSESPMSFQAPWRTQWIFSHVCVPTILRACLATNRTHCLTEFSTGLKIPRHFQLRFLEKLWLPCRARLNCFYARFYARGRNSG